MTEAHGANEALSLPAARPFLKWAGGKWALCPTLAGYLPADLSERTYREPFLGGGALFFWLSQNQPAKSYVLSDALGDLISTYEVVRRAPRRLIARLEKLRAAHSSDHFYDIRERFNAPRGGAIERASWLIYLNKTCYNGLYRTNRSGHFNVPVGRFVNPRVVDPPRLFAASAALKPATLERASFQHLREVARPGDVIYFDPPYVPLSKTSSFSAYSGGAFTEADQEELAALYRVLDRRGCSLLLSNSSAPLVKKLYKGFEQHPISVARVISAAREGRKPVAELLIRNRR